MAEGGEPPAPDRPERARQGSGSDQDPHGRLGAAIASRREKLDRLRASGGGPLSIRVERLTLLTKALHPPPEKWSGIRDPEARYRQRYVELAQDPESRKVVR